MEELIIIIVALLFGFWGYKIMEGKNRDTALGAILGVLFGIIGIIICYCFDKKESH